MDPRQRAVDRRRFLRTGVVFLVGLGLVGLGLVGDLVLPDRNESYYDRFGHRYEDPETSLFLLGAVLMLVALGDLVHRLVKGPQKPGKRSRF